MVHCKGETCNPVSPDMLLQLNCASDMNSDAKVWLMAVFYIVIKEEAKGIFVFVWKLLRFVEMNRK